MTLWFGHFPIQAIWEATKRNGIHPAFLMENPKSIDVSLWSCRGPWAPSCRWRAYPNNPGQIAWFSAAQLLTCFSRKTADRHIGVDNKKKHARCVMRAKARLCLHTCGRARRREVEEMLNSKWCHVSDRRMLSRRKTHRPVFKFYINGIYPAEMAEWFRCWTWGPVGFRFQPCSQWTDTFTNFHAWD